MTGVAQQHRLEQSHRFDWDAYNAQFDAKMELLRQSIAECDAIERAIHQAHTDFISDMKAIFGGQA
jgi:hypothetical protein